MKCKFKIVETLSKVVEVEADNSDSAYEEVEKMINFEEVVLTDDDFECREIYPVNDKEEIL